MFIIFLIRAYQYSISPLLSASCRFQPTCSEYFIDAVKKKGTLIGSLLGIRRLLRCHPLGGKGYDPVDV
ncbi:MAG: membrane protein insertion efficiency factor YidD [Planctomycetota bacterium]|nr:membrane protein insertion efficiency factor YidD [Planctomycetota bacterium]MDI6787337.1 membrane protein insertion efficiency factor YidD [Planctomycetota bacterium]